MRAWWSTEFVPQKAANLRKQVGALVGELRRAEEIDGIRARLAADLHHLVADLVDRLIPRDALPFAVDELQRILEAAVAEHEFARGRALGAMGAAIDRAVPCGLLPDPHAVLDFADDRATHGTMRAHVLFRYDRLRMIEHADRLGLLHAAERSADGRDAAGRKAGALEERAAIKRAGREPGGNRLQARRASARLSSLHEHWKPPQYRFVR